MDLLFSIFSQVNCYGGKGCRFQLGSWRFSGCTPVTAFNWALSLPGFFFSGNQPFHSTLTIPILSDQDQKGGYRVSLTNLIHVQLKYPTSRYYITMIPISTFFSMIHFRALEMVDEPMDSFSSFFCKTVFPVSITLSSLSTCFFHGWKGFAPKMFYSKNLVLLHTSSLSCISLLQPLEWRRLAEEQSPLWLRPGNLSISFLIYFAFTL